MPWGAVAGAVVGSVANKVLAPKNKSGLEAGESQASKEPWSEAAPWLKQNLAQGAALQDQYTQNPFNAQQQQAYGNQYAQSDYMQKLVPSLLGQLQSQQVGFDRNNPQAKPAAYQYGLLGEGGQFGAPTGSGGLLGTGSMQQAAQQQAASVQAQKEAAAKALADKQAAEAAAAAAAAKKQQEDPLYQWIMRSQQPGYNTTPDMQSGGA